MKKASVLALGTLVVAVSVVLPSSAQAQCRMGSGPDVGDGIPWCSQSPDPQPAEPVAPAQWQDMAAAIAWADSDTGSKFVGVSKIIDQAIAQDMALSRCRKQGWENCEIAIAVTNGVLAIARDNNRALRVSYGATDNEAKDVLLQKCAAARVTCTVLATFDGTAEYF